jgi:hypothetical protein
VNIRTDAALSIAGTLREMAANTLDLRKQGADFWLIRATTREGQESPDAIRMKAKQYGQLGGVRV